MPRPPVAEYWKARVRSLIEDPPDGKRLTDKPIADILEKEGQAIGRDDSPSERSVGRIRKEHKGLTEAEQREYRMLRWPESFQSRALPWEASAAALELLRMFDPYKTGERPTNRLARWFWRVSQAAPDAPDFTRRAIAGRLALAETLGDTRQRPAAEAFLFYRAWTPDGGIDLIDAQKPQHVADPLVAGWLVGAQKAVQAPDFPAFKEPVGEEALGDLIGPETKAEIDRLRETLQQEQKGR